MCVCVCEWGALMMEWVSCFVFRLVDIRCFLSLCVSACSRLRPSCLTCAWYVKALLYCLHSNFFPPFPFFPFAVLLSLALPILTHASVKPRSL